MLEILKILLYFFLGVSICGLMLVGVDKYNAIHNKYRISEATLMLFGFLGGALVMLIGMKLIRHKTRKSKFMISFPVFTLLHIIILLFVGIGL